MNTGFTKERERERPRAVSAGRARTKRHGEKRENPDSPLFRERNTTRALHTCCAMQDAKKTYKRKTATGAAAPKKRRRKKKKVEEEEDVEEEPSFHSIVEADICDVYFTQNTCSDRFRNGGSLSELTRSLRYKDYDPMKADFLIINVMNL